MIVVTGVTGTIDRRVLHILSNQGIRARALSRDPSQGEALPHVDWTEADLAQPGSLPPRRGRDRPHDARRL